MPFIPDASVLAAYSLACFVLFITPGPDMSFQLAKTLVGGRRAGIAAATGGGAVSSCIRCWRPSLCPFTPPHRPCSCPQTARPTCSGSPSTPSAAAPLRREGAPPMPPCELLGIGVNLTNPKVVLFFVTFLPQFIDAADPHAGAKLLFLGIYFVVFSYPLALLLVLGAERLVGTIKQRPRLLRAIDWLFAGIFSAFAVRIIATQAR
jgi:threonine/homoserine/homoserine lactone efflux protein